MRIIYLLGLFAIVMGALPAHAAQVYLDPEVREHGLLDTFYVPIRIDTQGVCINAVRIAVAYDPNEVSVRDVVTGDSILTLWTQRPSILRVDGKESGRVVLEGGIPGGYCGRVEGDPGLTNTLAKLVVQGVPQPLDIGARTTTLLIVEPEGAVYGNDGSGDVIDFTVLGAEIVLVQSTSTPKDIWKDDVTQDTISPDFFDIRLVRGPSEGNAYHYIAFSTTDKQSGVDHYEVLETDPERFGFLSLLERPAYWVKAESPYVLRDQRLHSKILVKAVDKKGNERIVEYLPPMSPFVAYTRASVLIPIVLFVGFVVILGALVVRFARSRRHKEEDRLNEEEQPENHELP